MPPVRLVFYQGVGLTGWAIRTVTWSDYDHVAMLLPDGSVLDVEPSAGVSEHAATRLPDATHAVLASDDVQRAALAWARQQEGDRYDWAATLGIAAHRDWREPGAWMCSELLCRAFEVAGMPLLRADHVNRITPGDLLMSTLLSPSP